MMPRSCLYLLYIVALFPTKFLTARKVREKYCDPNDTSYGETCEQNNYVPEPESDSPVLHDSSECKFFIAESTMPNGGLGIYTGVDVAFKETVADFDLPIQVVDLNIHHPEIQDWLLENHYWQSASTNAQHDAYHVKTSLPSFGILANTYPSSNNLEMESTGPQITELHRGKDPGAGAFSYYSPINWEAMKDIPKGSELFANYGESYLPTYEDEYGAVPMEEDYQAAKDILNKFLVATKDTSEGSIRPKMQQNVWDLLREVSNSRIKAALPEDASSLGDFKKMGSTALHLHVTPNTSRSIEWLKKHGQCVDSLSVKRSTVPQAGLGAFVKTNMYKGSVIVTTPLIQIHNKDHLDMYEVVYKSNHSKPRRTGNKDVVGKQLLLNYCFGHSNSSLLLFPYSPVVYLINHKKHDPNAEIRWSVHKYHNSDWLKMPIDELPVDQSGLMIDFVATRDIAVGEEIFLNYGSEWDEAWNRHVREWSPVEGAGEYEHVDDMNEKNGLNDVIQTVAEQKSSPYPSNLQTACYFRYYIDYEYEVVEASRDGDKDKVEYEWNELDGELYQNSLRPCDILDRYLDESEFLYNVRLYNSGGSEEDDIIPSNLDFIVFGMPRYSIEFINRLYSSDQFLKNAFRHSIGVPDGLYPPLWLDRED